MITLFQERLEAVGGSFMLVESAGELRQRLHQLTDGSSACAWERPELAGAGFNSAEPSAAQWSLVVADYAVAESGTVVLVHGPGASADVALLPPRQIVVVREISIVQSLGDALSALFAPETGAAGSGRGTANETGVPSKVVLVTGPSRTSDIELRPIVGVHSPREITVIALRE